MRLAQEGMPILYGQNAFHFSEVDHVGRFRDTGLRRYPLCKKLSRLAFSIDNDLVI